MLGVAADMIAEQLVSGTMAKDNILFGFGSDVSTDTSDPNSE
jgi:hypothetical protein